jgi:hypothetical protein
MTVVPTFACTSTKRSVLVEGTFRVRYRSHPDELPRLGFEPDVVPKRQDDALKKSKYLFTYESRPRWFALSAIGFQKLFQVHYVDVEQRRFRLVQVDEPLVKPIMGLRPEGSPPPRCPADLALAFERLAHRRFWVSPGTGRTAFNVYAPAEKRDAIVFGLYEDGRVWTDVAALGSVQASRLASALSSVGVQLDTNANGRSGSATQRCS